MFYRCDVFQEKYLSATADGGSTIEDICKSLKLPSDCVAAWINGEAAELHHAAAPGDTVNITVRPKAMQSLAQPTWWQRVAPWVGGGIGLGAQLLLSFWGRSRNESEADTAKSAVAENSTEPATGEAASVDGFGGAADKLLPQISGIANRSNPYGRWIQVLGKVTLAPPKSTVEYTYLNGDTEVLAAAFDLGYGPLEISNHKIGGRPLADFPGVSVEVRTGLPTDTPFTSVRAISSEVRFNRTLEPLVYSWADMESEGEVSGFDLYFPNGLYKIVRTTGANGYVTETREAREIRVQIFSGTSIYEAFISDNRPTSFRQSFFVPVTPKGKYPTYCIRYTAKDPDAVDDVVWTKLQSQLVSNPWNTVRDSKGNVVYPARVALVAPASDEVQGQLEQYTCEAASLVPTWDGDSWTSPAVSSNPAWLALHVMRGQANYDPVPDDEIDLPSFVAWAEHCDALGIKYNRQVDTDTQPQAVLNSLFTLGRAKQVERDGKVSVVIDKAQTQVVQHFTSRNAWGFHWKATRGKTPDCIKVQFINRDKDNAVDERLVFRAGKDASNFATMQTVLLEGCDDAETAHKYGRFLLKQDEARRRTYQWYTTLEALVCTRGDLVRASSFLIGAGLGTGIVKQVIADGSGNITAIRIDSRVQMISGKTYKIEVRLLDGSYYSGAVVNTPGNVSLFTLSTPIPAATEVKPVRGDLLKFGETPEISRELIVTNVEWTENFIALISAVDHAPSIYESDSEAVPPFVSNIQRRHPLIVEVEKPIIREIRSDEKVMEKGADGGYHARIALDMEPPARNVDKFEVQFRQTGGTTWITQVFPANAGVIKVSGVESGVRYDLQVRARTYDSWISEWNKNYSNYLCIGNTTPPPDLPPLELDPDTGNPRAYTDVDKGFDMPLDFAGIRWKMHWGHNEDWASATIISQLSTATTIDVSKFAKGLKTFLAKAVDVAGNESANAAILVRDYGDPIPDNIVEEFDYSPDYPGTITNGAKVGSTIEAIDSSLYWSGDPNKKVWNNPGALFWGTSFSELVYEFEYKPDRNTILKPFLVKLAVDIDSSNYKIEYALVGNNYFWDRNAAGGARRFYTGASNKFWTSSLNWLPMPETGLEGIHGRYRFRITCAANRYKSVINSVKVIVDVPDVIKRYSGLVISNPSAGVAIPILSGTFRQIKYVNPALVKDSSYPNAKTPEADRSVNPPVIRMFDAAGAYTTGKVDVEVGGY